MPQSILIIEDEEALARFVELELTHEGYLVEKAFDGRDGLQKALEGSHDLILLDIMLPSLNGLEVLRRLRREKKTPVILLTARDAVMDKVTGLDMGADDYITKPFSPREVLARVKTVLRRMREMRDEVHGTLLTVGNLSIDMGAFTVRLNGQNIPCTPKEIEILWTLASNPGMVFSREHLLQSIWGYDFLGDTRAVDSHIKRIRAKLCQQENPWDIRTVWGVGYRFEILT